MTVQDETTASEGIILSDAAASKVKSLLEQEGRDDLALRVAVQPGGCSGLRYQLFFDERSLDGDVVKDFGGVKVVTDRMSAPYLGGASIDFVDTIEKQGFTIDNPNATGSCACGVFALPTLLALGHGFAGPGVHHLAVAQRLVQLDLLVDLLGDEDAGPARVQPLALDLQLHLR